MKIGAQIRNSAPWEKIRDVVQAADDQRWRSLWFADHLLQPGAVGGQQPAEDQPFQECWTLLAAVAALTSRVRIGSLVSAVTFRHPAILAKMAATVDQISNGRLELGLGAAWHPREHEAYGFSFPSARDRADMLEEQAAVLRAFFHNTPPHTFEGHFVQLRNAPFAPSSRIPIMIGGEGEKRTLRTLALYGDTMNLAATSPESVAHKIHVVEEHCKEVGRDPKTIRRTIRFTCIPGDDEEKVRKVAGKLGWNLDDANEYRNAAVGKADHIISVIKQYDALQIDEAILQMLPVEPELYAKLDREVLVAFD